MKSVAITTGMFAMLLALAAPALAQKAPVVGPDKRTVIDMDEDVIEGVLRAPDAVVLVRSDTRNFRSLIQVRKDFRKEILASGAQL